MAVEAEAAEVEAVQPREVKARNSVGEAVLPATGTRGITTVALVVATVAIPKTQSAKLRCASVPRTLGSSWELLSLCVASVYAPSHAGSAIINKRIASNVFCVKLNAIDVVKSIAPAV